MSLLMNYYQNKYNAKYNTKLLFLDLLMLTKWKLKIIIIFI